MKSQTTRRLIGFLTVCALSCSAVFAADDKAPEKKPGYDKTKDVGAAAPKGADVPFDGTPKSIKENWQMWPKADMPITWSLVDSPTGDGKVLMTNGGKSWGTHDLVTKKKYTDFEGHVEFIMMGKRGDDSRQEYENRSLL